MRLFSFQGRISRAAYARAVICAYLLFVPLGLVMAIAVRNIDPAPRIPVWLAQLADVTVPLPVAWMLAIVALVVLLGILVFFLSIDVRRFHDCNVSGWFVPLWIVVMQLLPDRDLGPFLPSLAALIWIAAMITIPGTRGANTYGPDPLAGDVASNIEGSAR